MAPETTDGVTVSSFVPWPNESSFLPVGLSRSQPTFGFDEQSMPRSSQSFVPVRSPSISSVVPPAGGGCTRYSDGIVALTVTENVPPFAAIGPMLQVRTLFVMPHDVEFSVHVRPVPGSVSV